MINVTPDLIKSLSEIGLKVYNENFLTSKCEVPCISYYEYDNSVNEDCDVLGYSDITYHIKVWAKTQKELVDYSAQIDSIMRKLHFVRLTCNDLWTNTLGQRDMKYKALAFEKF